MGLLSRFRLRLTTLLVMAPHAALAMTGGAGAGYVAVILFLAKLASGTVMARQAMPVPASSPSRGKALGTAG